MKWMKESDQKHDLTSRDGQERWASNGKEIQTIESDLSEFWNKNDRNERSSDHIQNIRSHVRESEAHVRQRTLMYVTKHLTQVIGVKNSFWTLQTRPHVRHCSSHVRESSKNPAHVRFVQNSRMLRKQCLTYVRPNLTYVRLYYVRYSCNNVRNTTFFLAFDFSSLPNTCQTIPGA